MVQIFAVWLIFVADRSGVMMVPSVFTHSDFTRVLHANDGGACGKDANRLSQGRWLEEQTFHSGVLFVFSLVL